MNVDVHIMYLSSHTITQGRNINNLKLYKGSHKLQYGNGIYFVTGSSLGGIFRRVISYLTPIVNHPLVKSGFKTIGNELLQGGIEVLNDNSNRSLQQVIQNEMGKRLQNLTEKAKTQLQKNLTTGENIRKRVLKGGSIKARKRKKNQSFIRGLLIKKSAKKRKLLKKRKTGRKKSRNSNNLNNIFD